MGQIIHPNSYKYKGPWLLNRDAFDELAQILSEIDTHLQKAFETEILNFVLSENVNLSEEQLAQSITKAKSRYPFDKKVITFYLKSKDRIKLEGKTLVEILRDKSLTSFSPEGFHGTIRYGDNLNFEININRYSDDLEYEIDCSDQQINDEIRDSIEQWIEKNKPNAYVSFWSNWGIVFTFLLPIIVIIFAGLSFLNFDYVDTAARKAEAVALIKEGIDSSNIYRAVEVILKIESNYQPDNFVPIKHTTNPVILKLFIFFLLLFIVSLIRPKTTIGLGKRKNYFTFYKLWIKFVTITLPTLLIISPFWNKIKELWAG